MKIVFDNIVFSLQSGGGISVVWFELLKRMLATTGIGDIFFIEHPTDHNNMFRKNLDLPLESILPASKLPLTLERYVNPRVNNSESFIFHSSYLRTCSNKNAINVTTVHDFTYDYFYKGKRRGAFLHLWQRNRAIRKADAIICISENTKKDLLKFLPDVNPNRIHVIYNGVSDDYQVISEKNTEYAGWLLWVGWRNNFKNGRFFAEAIKDTDYKVVYCGRAMTDEEIHYYDETLGRDRYKLLTDLSNEELNRLYNSVKCLVYPSSYEGFGIPVIEAQKAGCPVIAYNASSIPEIIGETPLLMNELTKEELLKKLALLDDSTIRQNVIKKGLENSKRFSWDKTYQDYHNLYQSLFVK